MFSSGVLQKGHESKTVTCFLLPDFHRLCGFTDSNNDILQIIVHISIVFGKILSKNIGTATGMLHCKFAFY